MSFIWFWKISRTTAFFPYHSYAARMVEPADIEDLKSRWELGITHRANSFTNMTAHCFSKCVGDRHKSGEVFLGESTCLDRCASKYMQVVAVVGRAMAKSRDAGAGGS
mmetsp:Transcript_521/g.1148  ORF Transcript_521/g.1148 Transcript_521/m.1148 type:complete len:108 (-) Transcript_521:610-933(-)